MSVKIIRNSLSNFLIKINSIPLDWRIFSAEFRISSIPPFLTKCPRVRPCECGCIHEDSLSYTYPSWIQLYCAELNCGWMSGCTFPRQKGRTNSSLFFPFVYLMALVIINRCGVIRNYSWVYIGRWLHGTLLELNFTLVLLTRKGFVKYFVCWTILLQIRPVFLFYLTQHLVCVGKWAIKFRNEFWIWTFFPAPKRVWASPFDYYSHLNPPFDQVIYNNISLLLMAIQRNNNSNF